MPVTPTPPDPQLEALLSYLQDARGFAFTSYKRSTLSRRIMRRMQEVGVSTFEEYTNYLEVHADEFALLFNTVLVNVTRFFRDPEVWDYLAADVIPRIIAARGPSEEDIRVWCAGCSTGEEVYSVAMLLAEALGPDEFHRRVKVYGTDLDEEALAVARQGMYPVKSLDDIPEHLREKYFDRVGARAVFRDGLRRALIFGRHDLTRDAPISRLDLLLCRNTLMYLISEGQEAVLGRLYFALRDDGYLCLGKAEMILGHGRYFVPVDARHRVFAKARDVRGERVGYGPVGGIGHAQPAPVRLLRDAAFSASPIGQIVVNFEGWLVAANDEARSQFSIHDRDIPRPLQDLEISYRPLELRSRIEQAHAERRTLIVRNVERTFSDGKTQLIDVSIVPIASGQRGEPPLGTVIAYADVTSYNSIQAELKRTGEELSTAYEELQSANEELETSNEELQSTVEELETSNEELQSTVEELETTNEELQATNEELETTNEELRLRGDEVDSTNDFLESILASESTAVIVVDDALCVRLWNPASETMWGLRSDEVGGRPLFALDFALARNDELAAAMRKCVDQASRREELVLDTADRLGRSMRCRVVCTPLAGRLHRGAVILSEVTGSGRSDT